ncbi:NAD(P)/FAD-dependent oxidoreductase [Albidovulum sediminicola]|uniref:FAD-binding oxidoreductase n=1 Tax=Albidovulum sediminicola TaxID=2984331 RepID=A0ABT2Z6T8_9RHOB|nr:FAD-dependent oxidoreductase [Defluviimonas sp. WL0075]MCV2866850.1 FAD-binding oxidoreductase [Defluviimonas sp. WL0075]
MAETVEIAIVGAGVVGLAIAHRLASAGREVVVIDPAPPGSGASYGNAGTVADYAVQPVGTPEVLKNLPALLFDRNSPLAIRKAALPTLAPWLLRFAWQSLPAAARRNALALAGILHDAAPRWRDLASEIGGEGILQARGCLYWYRTDRALAAAEADFRFRRACGVAMERLTATELAALEPGLPVTGGGAAFFPGALFMTDPGAMVSRLAQAAWTRGARHLAARVTGLCRTSGGVHLSGPDLAINARHAVIAAGAHSRNLALQAGDRIPLDTERGYHLEWDMTQAPLTRPVCPTDRGFYLCPMEGRLRAAGTVELGGLTAPPSAHRLARLADGARSVLPDLPEPSRDWMGFRPSIPDSLPVVGPSRGGKDVLFAFGHGHIGLTLAPITAAMIAAEILGSAPLGGSEALRATRF